jgi:hypothetical protein
MPRLAVTTLRVPAFTVAFTPETVLSVRIMPAHRIPGPLRTLRTLAVARGASIAVATITTALRPRVVALMFSARFR